MKQWRSIRDHDGRPVSVLSDERGPIARVVFIPDKAKLRPWKLEKWHPMLHYWKRLWRRSFETLENAQAGAEKWL